MMKHLGMAWLLGTSLLAGPGHAEVVSTSGNHFALRHEGVTALTAEEAWRRLVKPASWWDARHTYSGDAANLSLDLDAGGLWREDWDGGSIAHGRVLFIDKGRALRLEAPFGPLQGIGAYVIWTITLETANEGTRIVFEESAIGPPVTDYEELAKAVDFVKSEAMRSLTAAQ